MSQNTVDPTTRKSGLPKTTGSARYASDIYPEGVLTGIVVRSPHPHARIHKIDARAARRMPGVHAVVTAADIPGPLRRLGKTVEDQPILAQSRTRTLLDALALIAADDEQTARRAAQALDLELEPFPAVFTVEDALAPGAPSVHEGDNLLKELVLSRGDVDSGFAEADVILEDIYHTPAIEHAYLEPDAGTALPLKDGGMRIWIGCHTVFEERRIAAGVLGIPLEKVEVIQPYTGGSFGGKDDGLLTAYLALLAYHTGRPVRMVFSREELFRSHTKRHGQQIRVRMGARRDGVLTAADYQIVTDTGAYAHWAEGIFTFCSIGAPGPYRTPHLRVTTKVVYTNNIPMGAMRAWGMPGVTFATESHLDQLARCLELHPLRLRWLNAADEGDKIITGQALPPGVGIRATLDAAATDYDVQLSE